MLLIKPLLRSLFYWWVWATGSDPPSTFPSPPALFWAQDFTSCFYFLAPPAPIITFQRILSKAPIMAFSGTQQKCKACDKTVYVIDQLTADGVVYHQACFRCTHCKRTLTLSDYSSFEGVPYCKPHFEQLFKMTGSFKKSFESNAARPKEGELQRTPSKAGSFKFTGTQEKCVSCGKTVYPLEKVSVENMSYHKSCFKCLQGGCSISPSNYAALEGRLYCKHHFAQLFKEKGNYSQLLVKMPSIKHPAPTDA